MQKAVTRTHTHTVSAKYCRGVYSPVVSSPPDGCRLSITHPYAIFWLFLFTVFFLIFVLSLSHYCLILSFTLLSFSSRSHLYIIFLRFALTLSHEFLVSLYRLFLILIFFVSCIYHPSHLFSFFTSSFSCLSHYGLMLPFRLLTFFSLSHLFFLFYLSQFCLTSRS